MSSPPEEFRFLVDELGFREHRAALHDGALEVDWKHATAGTALHVVVGPAGATEGWFGRLDRRGRLRPLDRDTIDRDWVLLAPPEPLEQCARDVRSFGRKLLQPEVFFGG